MVAITILTQTVFAASQAPAPVVPAHPYEPFGAGAGWGYGYGMGPGMMGYGMWFGGLLSLLVLVGIIAGVVFLVRSLFTGRPGHPQGPGAGRGTAQKLLDERYARGDIGRDEYLEKKRDLSG